MSEETESSGESHGAPVGFGNTSTFKKKAAKNNPMNSPVVLMGILGVIGCIIAILATFVLVK